MGFLRLGLISGSGSGIAAWAPLKLGAGGFVRNIDFADDGTLVCSTDVYGAYLWDAAAPSGGNDGGTGIWRQLCNVSRFPASDPATTYDNQNLFASDLGAYAIGIAPNDSNTLYMLCWGYAYKSTNKGATWTNLTNWTPVGQSAMPANDQSSPNWFGQCGRKISVDPISSSIAFWCTQTGGLYKTLNGGTTITSVSGVPTSTRGVWTAYDRRVSTQSGGVSQTLYAFSYGTGCYKSTDGGVNWTKISGSGTSATAITTCRRIEVDTLGNVWVVGNDNQQNNNVFKYNGTSWSTPISTFSNNSSPYHSICFDPTVANSQRIILGSNESIITQSTDGGATWFGAFQNANGDGGYVATGIPWINGLTDRPLNGNMIFAPGTSTIWNACGVGVRSATPTTNPATSFNWTDQSEGIEELVMNQVISPPNGGNVICLAWDRSELTQVNKALYPTTYNPATFVFPPGGTSGCYVPGTPDTVFFHASGALYKSTDKGINWTSTSGVPNTGAGGGCLAALTSTLLVFVQHSGGGPYYTTDGGATWNSLVSYFSSNFSISGGGGWNISGLYVSNDQMACSDGTALFLYNIDSTNGGIFRSTNGSTWTRQSALGGANQLPTPAAAGGGGPRMIAVPGKTGHLLVSNGKGYEPDSGRPQSTQKFWMSTDAGVTWAAFANVLEPWVIGAGKQAAGATYPTLAFWGWYNGVPGVYLSHDQGFSWTKIGEQTLDGNFDFVRWMCVDNNTDDTVYVAKIGSGVSRYGT